MEWQAFDFPFIIAHFLLLFIRYYISSLRRGPIYSLSQF